MTSTIILEKKNLNRGYSKSLQINGLHLFVEILDFDFFSKVFVLEEQNLYK